MHTFTKRRCVKRLTRFLTLTAFLSAGLYANAEDFTYQGLKYTIVDPELYTAKVSGVDSIGEYVTVPTDALNDKVPYAVVAIADSAFNGQKNMKAITISEGVESIGRYAFSHCEAMQNVNLPQSLTTLGDGVFHWCPSLISVTLPKQITEIPDLTFYWCSNLRLVDMPDGITRIGNSAFVATHLPEFTAPEGVTEIGHHCFIYNEYLKTVTLPSTLQAIGDNAFSGCKAMREINCKMAEPFECHPDFISFVQTMATVFVPTGKADTYRSVFPWSAFARIKEKDFPNTQGVVTGCNQIECDAPQDDQPMAVFTLSGAQVSTSLDGLQPGMYLVKSGNSIKKVLL